MKRYKVVVSILFVIFIILCYNIEYKQQEQPAILSGFFVGVFNVSNGEVQDIPSNITETEILSRGYEIIHINNTVLEDYPILKSCLKEDKKYIDLTDEEAILIIRNFRGKVVEYNKNYYEIAIGQY